MSERQADEIIELLKDINDKLDRIIYQELRANTEELQDIKCYAKIISQSGQ